MSLRCHVSMHAEAMLASGHCLVTQRIWQARCFERGLSLDLSCVPVPQAAQPDRAKRWQSTAAAPPDWQGASLGHRGDATQRPQQAAPRSPLAQQQRSAGAGTGDDGGSRGSTGRHGRGGRNGQQKAQQAPPDVVRSGRRSRADRQNSRGSGR